MFVDQIKITVEAGKGGDGIVAYRRELKVPLGGPYGGRGGKGGDIIFVGNKNLSTLLDYRYNRNIKGKDGQKGMNKGMTGRNAVDTYLYVPLGTTIFDDDTNKVICDILYDKEEVVVCKGGRGGRGNMDFKTHANPCPSICENGEPGESLNLRLELRVLADCGLVGFPSVGKSTIISMVSNATPKIADYPFTTLVPNLGMVYVNEGKSFVMADLPGLIEGASLGYGLGFQFLRHIERCKVIVHVLDISREDCYSDYLKIKEELKTYNLDLENRNEIIVVNKMDDINANIKFHELEKKFNGVKLYPVSAYLNHGLQDVIYAISRELEKLKDIKLFEDVSSEVIYKFIEDEKPFEIEKNGNIFYVTGEKLKKLYLMTDFTKEENIKRFVRQLRSLNLDEELRNLDAKNGDIVKVFDFEFEYYE